MRIENGELRITKTPFSILHSQFIESLVWIYQNYRVPIKIYRERRKNVRASIGKTAAILRMPKGLGKAGEAKYMDWFENWLKKELDTQKRIQQRFLIKTYQSGDTLTIQDKTFTLHISYENRKSHEAKLKGDTIYLKLSESDDKTHLQKSIKQLLSRIIAQVFQKDIERRVDNFNDQYFQENIKTIRLKYNQSNWGSCSSNRNLNFSTRLLFAPSEVIDYVIVHELAHLKEMNHSHRFWKIVGDIMPNYKRHELWLKEYGYLCDF